MDQDNGAFIKGVRIEKRAEFNILVYEAGGCRSATPPELILWRHVQEMRKAIHEAFQPVETLGDRMATLQKLKEYL